MTDLIRIHDEVVSAEAFVNRLKINGRFDDLLEELVEEKLTFHAGTAMGIEASAEEIQTRADQIRRVMGLHRAADMNQWLDQMRVGLDDFEQFIVEALVIEKTETTIVSDDAVESYFQLNSPKFDALLLSHIVVDSVGKANEIKAIALDEPDMFEELARTHSTADTAADGGYLGTISRGMLINDVEAKVFHAGAGDVVGPFETPDKGTFEIFMINDKRPATLDDATRQEVKRLMKKEWLAERAQEIRIEMC